MFRVIRTFGLALGLLGGVVAAQAPEFAQQYAQRLGGAADELRRQVAVLESDAQASGTTRDGAVDRLRSNPDQLVARRGEAARDDIARLARLSAQQQALATASSPLGRVVAMLRDPDLPVVRAAYHDFSPAVPTTADGLAAGLIGFFAAWSGWRVVSDVGRRVVRRRPRTAATVA
ncbi:hypothetical protein GOFOIKOB_4317 [Methylobacterium tardum]|uniref:DUF2937 family protein n=1 Tax=Methylobacterium tardum TaxID=374432 RepID=A0AA37WT86_9HYPH|nr:DUF2937 family protein [Methylobacterium tardum]URD37137.1 DUF2937 family protein [Methylobacterium tardum]GJE51262.1 hypothetical protein GOFOIKOB_4317 [Methylobacterium tardum]GLS71007.1 hypothetical protein GCM10007890_30200 [Methylobacterium tardum]